MDYILFVDVMLYLIAYVIYLFIYSYIPLSIYVVTFFYFHSIVTEILCVQFLPAMYTVQLSLMSNMSHSVNVITICYYTAMFGVNLLIRTDASAQDIAHARLMFSC